MPNYRRNRVPGGTYFFTRQLDGWAGTVADWPYSSFHRLIEMGVYSSNWARLDWEPLRVGEREI